MGIRRQQSRYSSNRAKARYAYMLKLPSNTTDQELVAEAEKHETCMTFGADQAAWRRGYFGMPLATDKEFVKAGFGGLEDVEYLTKNWWEVTYYGLGVQAADNDLQPRRPAGMKVGRQAGQLECIRDVLGKMEESKKEGRCLNLKGQDHSRYSRALIHSTICITGMPTIPRA